MMAFISGEIDVLVATTIIETGLDISNVNTIIIDHADKRGCHSFISFAVVSEDQIVQHTRF